MALEMQVKGLMIDPVSQSPIIVLRDASGDAVLPIWVGIFEANAIAVMLERIPPPRPMTHDLLRSLIETLRAQARADIEELVAGLTELEQKAAGGQELTPDEADRYRTLQTTLMAVDERYKREIEEAAEPARLAVDQALAELSQEHDYTMVLDSIVAADLGLIVYADPSLDITQLVIDRVSGQ